MRKTRKKIGEVLLESRRVTEEDLRRALEAQSQMPLPRKRVGEILVEMGVLTERQVTEALGLQFMWPVVNVADYMANVAVQNEVPRDLMEQLNVFPLEFQEHNSVLLIAISDPQDEATQDRLEMELKYPLRFALATAREIQEALMAGRAPMATAVPQAAAVQFQATGYPTSAPIPTSLGGPAMPMTPMAPVNPVAPMASAAPVAPVMPMSNPAPAQTFSPMVGNVGNMGANVITANNVAPIQQTVVQGMPPSGALVPTAMNLQPTAQPQTPQPPSPGAAIAPTFLNLQTKQPRLGDVLVAAGAITEADVTRALQIQKGTNKKLGEIFVSEGIISATRLAEALADQLKLPLVPLTRYRAMPSAIKLVPRAVAERLVLIPLAFDEQGRLFITMSNPLDLLAQDEVRMLTGYDLKVGISTQEDIVSNLDRLYNLQSNLEEAIIEIEPGSEGSKEIDFDADVEDAPVIQLVSNLLQQAVREGASDIHVEAYEKIARVRFRVDGQLYTAFEYPVGLHPSVTARLKIMSGMDIAEKRKPQDGRILIRVDGRRIDLRVSVLPTMNGEKGVLRILDQESASVGLDRLGLEPDDMEKIEMFCGMPWGIMLVTGPTGSGKSTTLYSMLQRINQPDVNIITVEDPVEFSVAGINQVHVNEKAGLTFESALRSILRQDPDKVMVGEIRDQKTAQIAIRAALTGHFVLSTLHTNDAPSAATRMIDMGVAPFLVSASLSGVIAQRLVRRLCPICREEYVVDDNTCKMINVPSGTHAFRPRGCNECRNGYKGRRGIYEIMVLDDDLRRMILDGVSNIELRQAAIDRGMKTLRQSGINGALAGFTSLEEVFSTTL